MLVHHRESNIHQTKWLYLYLVMTYTPTIRYVARSTISEAKQAAWLAPIVAMVLFIPFLLLIGRLMKMFSGVSYHDILCKVFGKYVGKALVVVIILWLMILLGLYRRYAADKLVNTIYTGTDMRLIWALSDVVLIAMLFFGLAVIARVTKVIFFLLLVQVIVIALAALPNADMGNLTPLSRLDVQPLLNGAGKVMVVNSYLAILLVFNDQVTTDNKLYKRNLAAGGFVTIAQIMIIAVLLSVFSWGVAEQLSYPFSSLVKTFMVLEVVSGLEAFYLSLWSLAEYCLMAILSYSILRLLKGLFNLKSSVPMIGAFVIFMFFLGEYISEDIFELMLFSEIVAAPTNLILGIGLPILVYIVAKVRKIA